jgi:hypothetical protein
MKLMAKAPATVTYACPMHPEITSAQPDRCSKCRMTLVPSQFVRPSAHASHDAHAGAEEPHEHQRESRNEHAHQPAGIEWEDGMIDVNRMTNPTNMRWKLIDRDTGAEGEAID